MTLSMLIALYVKFSEAFLLYASVSLKAFKKFIFLKLVKLSIG